MVDDPSRLPLALWELRELLEAQLRCVATVQRVVDTLPAYAEQRRADLAEQVIDDLGTLSDAGRRIATAASDARAQARAFFNESNHGQFGTPPAQRNEQAPSSSRMIGTHPRWADGRRSRG
jgi:hypothetical protein